MKMGKVFRSLFRPFQHHEASKMERLTDDELSRRLHDATEGQKKAAMGVKTAAIRQIREADYIRETLNGVLARINEREKSENG